MIRTRFSLLGFYFPCLLLASMMIAGVLVIFWSSVIGFAGNDRDSNFLAGCLGAALIIFAILISRFLQEDVYKAEINANEIRLRGFFSDERLIRRNDIQSIDLFTKGHFAFDNHEALAIEQNDGSKLKLADPCYRNMPELKKFLQDNYTDLIKPMPGLAHMQERESRVEKFSGRPLLTLNGILVSIMFGLLLFVSVSFFEKQVPFNWLDLFRGVVPFAILFLPFSGIFYYFKLTPDGLIVKNHFKPWYKKTYPFGEIAGVVFESHYRGPIRCLRIRTRDFRSKLYAADSLRKRTWMRFSGELRKSGIWVA